MTGRPLEPTSWQFDPAAWPEDDCVAVGADLEPGTIVDAYRHGAFPMPHEGQVMWWSPLQRGVLKPADLRISRSLAKSARHFEVTVDQSFVEVIDACADPSRTGSWIDEPIRAAYIRLHEAGWAHSFETRDDEGRLVGGLYGLGIGALFAGESMFHRVTDASKVALIALATVVGPAGLIDTQWRTPHLATLGVEEWSRRRYLDAIAELVDAPGPPVWH